MKYRQLLLLILAVWAGQIAVPYAYQNILPRKIDYRTYPLLREADGEFRAKELENKLGDKGWVLTQAIPDPKNNDKLICFFHRQTILKWNRD
jgi:hypothetical protein